MRKLMRMLYWLRATLFPRKKGKPALEFQALIAKAVNAGEPCPMVIQWDKGGYAIDVTLERGDLANGNAVVILGTSRTYPLTREEIKPDETFLKGDGSFRDRSAYAETLELPDPDPDPEPEPAT